MGKFAMDDPLRHVLETLDPKARDDLRRVLIRDLVDRDAISSRLMRYQDQNGKDWADIIDFLTCIRTRELGPRWRDGVGKAPGAALHRTDPLRPAPSTKRVRLPGRATSTRRSESRGRRNGLRWAGQTGNRREACPSSV
jgi:hypothetical protein